MTIRHFTAGELARFRGTQESAMQDTCEIGVYSDVADSWGNPTPTWTYGAAIICGVEHVKPNETQASNQVPEVDAIIRLPIATVIDPKDHIKVTHRYGEAITEQVFEIAGLERRGPSGLRANCMNWVRP